MRDFLLGEGLPFVLVCVAVTGLTVALFGLPKPAPPVPVTHVQSAMPSASARRMDEALTRAIAALKAARNQTESVLPPPARPAPLPNSGPPSKTPRTGGAAAPSAAPVAAATAAPGLPAVAAPAVAPAPILSAVTSLSEAMKSIRGARTEEDFVRAEEQMRAVRAQMQAACASGANSAFCDSAREMDSLGY